MLCTYCNYPATKKDFQKNGTQKLYCKTCKKHFVAAYKQNARLQHINEWLINLLKEGCSIRGMARLLKISCNTVLTRIKSIADKITRPYDLLLNKEYEVDELKTYIGKKSRECWITYAIRKEDNAIIDFTTGIHNEEVQKKLIKSFIIQHKLNKRKMANLALAISQKIRAYAYATGNTTLFGEMKFSFAKLFYRNANLAKTLAETIYAAANAVPVDDKVTYNLTAPVLLELRNAIDLYAAGTPRDKIVIRKTATDNFSQLFKDAETILKNNLDNLMGNYTGTEFAREYENARLVIPHTIHTTIQGVTTDEETGGDIKDVQVLILSDTQQFEDITDPQGKFAQPVSPEITYRVRFIIPGYEEKELSNIKLPRGKHERLNVKFKRVQPA